MDPTVTNGGGMTHASTLAEKAAAAIGDGEVAAADLSWASMALSLAEMAKSTRILAEQAGPEPQCEPAVLSADSPVGTVAVVGPKRDRYVRCCDIPFEAAHWRRASPPGSALGDWATFEWLQENDAVLLAPGPVPLASADLLSDEAMNDVFGQINHGLTSSPKGRDTYRRIADAVNARLRAQFPDETPLPDPAPAFVRGVAELSDDELDSIYRRANDFTPHYELSVEERAFTQAIVAGVAARLRVDGPDGEQPLAEMTAHALNAAKVGSTVMDSESEQWTKTGPERWRCDCGAHIECLSGPLVDSFGPLRELRSPAEITAEMLDAAEVGWTVDDDHGADWGKHDDGRWRLPSWAPLTADQLIKALGPLSNLRPPSQPAKPERPAADPFDNDIVSSRATLIAAALRSAAEVHEIGSAHSALVAANADVDAAAREHVSALHGPTVGADVLSIARVLTDDTIGTGGYDPAKLAFGSVILADGKLWVKIWSESDSSPWRQLPGGSWRSSSVPTDGVLVVDGAQLGGGR